MNEINITNDSKSSDQSFASIEPQFSAPDKATKPSVLPDNANEIVLAQEGLTIPFEAPKAGTNKVYEEIIQELYMGAFDIKGLGDKDAAMQMFKAEMKSDEDGLKYADKFMESTPDAHDDVFTKEEIAGLTRAIGGKDKGIGLVVQMPLDATNRETQNGPFLIEKIIKGSKAETIGLRRGDKITAIDGVDASKVNHFQLESHLARPDRENIELRIERDGSPMIFKVPKVEMDRPAIHDHLDGKIAYIKIDSFLNENLTEDLKKVLEKYKDAEGFVIDLRDNTGGLFNEALTAAQLFVDNGNILKVKDRVRSDPSNPIYKDIEYGVNETEFFRKESVPGQETKTVREKRFPDLVDKPVVVLTNGYSASAAEIFAGALRDNGDAKILGATTYGKGDGQRVVRNMPLGSALKLTSFRYYSPNGTWFGDGGVNRIGLTPDVKVLNRPGSLRLSTQDTQYQEALRRLRGNG